MDRRDSGKHNSRRHGDSDTTDDASRLTETYSLKSHAFSSVSEGIEALRDAASPSHGSSSAGASTVLEVQREIIKELNSHSARKEKVRA